MADERAKIDANRKAAGVVAGLKSTSGEIYQLRVDDTTGRLMVDCVITSGLSSQTGVVDGEAVDAADLGVLVLGTDGSNYQILKVNSDGELAVNIETSDIEIGAVEIKDHDGTDRVAVNASNELQVRDDDAITLLGTIDADTSNMATSLGNLDNAVDGNYLNVNANIAGTDFVGGAGAVAAGVQRTTLASDDPAVVALQIIDDWDSVHDSAISSDGAVVMAEAKDHDFAALPNTVSNEGDAVRIAATLSGVQYVMPVSEDGGNYATVIVRPEATFGTSTYTEASTTGFPIGAVRNDTLAALVDTDNEIAPLQVNASGALYTAIDGTVTVDLGGNNDVTMATLPDTAAGDLAAMVTDLAAIEALAITIDSDTNDIKTAVEIIDDIVQTEDAAHSTGDKGVMALGVENEDQAALSGGDKDYTPIAVSAEGNVLTEGTIAHSGADAGFPHKIGGRAQDIIGAEPEEVSDNDRVDALFDQNGRLGVTAGSDYKYADINDASSGDNTIIAAQAAGKRIAVWAILIVSDGTTDVRWEDGAGSTAFTGQVPLQVREGYSISAGGLVPLFVGSAATLLNLELTAAVNVHGFVSYTVLED